MKEPDWSTLSCWRKVRHVITIILSLLIIGLMWFGFLYIVLFVFGIYGWLLKLRDFLLLDIIHTIIG